MTLTSIVSPVFGQTASARLEGVVQDTSGAVVPNAKVTATNINTQAVSETVTGV